MNIKETISFSKKLLAMVFRPKGRAKEEMQKLEEILCTKTWLFHCFAMLSRVVYPLFGFTYWQKGFRDKDEITKLRLDFVEQVEVPLTTAIIAMIPIGVLIDIICWKRRSFAKLIIYYEAVSMLLQGFVPFDFGSL